MDRGRRLTVRVELAVRETWGLALQVADVPLIDAFEVHNDGGERLVGLRWSIAVEPGGAVAQGMLPPLDPGEDASIEVPALEVPAEDLVGGVLRVEWRVTRHDRELAHGDAAVEVLPWDRWPGEGAPAQLLASFVLPDHPTIATLTANLSGDPLDAARSLLGLTGTFAVDAMPGDFERAGVAIRTPDRAVAERRGTRADLAALVAAGLERLGCGALLAWTADRVLVGAWLGDDRFPEGVVSSLARVRQAEGLAWFDPAERDLAAAIDAATEALADEDRFRCAIDLRVARSEGYKPLPAGWTPAARRAEPRAMPDDGASARVRAWKERLLDLSLRNKLLAFRSAARTTIPLDVVDLGEFADRLVADGAFELVARPPEPFAPEDPEAIERVRYEKRVELQAGVIPVPLIDGDRIARAVALDRAGRLELEEGGANTLFAAIGFVRWSEGTRRPRSERGDDDSTEELSRSRRLRAPEVERLAPLLLVPIALEIARSTRRVRVRRLPEDPVANVTLIEKLRRDYDVDLSPVLAFDQQERPIDVPFALEAARRAIEAVPGWAVEERAALAHLTFAKFLVWRDLEDNADRLLENPVVQHIARRSHAPFPNPVAATEPGWLDERVAVRDLPLVLDADATQTAAIHSALSGRSFVLQGPPGTGKSQTIANLVASAIGQGKTVLVVAEKMAALDVVHRRLREVGLGDACLELHSHKANKRDFIASLAASLKREPQPDGPSWEERAADLQETRAELNAYVKALHALRPAGWTFWEAAGRLLPMRDQPVLPLELPGVAALTERQWDELLEHGARFATAAADVEPASEHPWADTRVSEWSVASEQGVQAKLAKAAELLRTAREAREELARWMEVPPPALPSQVIELAALGTALADSPVPPGAIDPDEGEWFVERARTFSSAYATWQARSRTVATRWHPSLYNLDLPRLARQFGRWIRWFWPISWLMLRGLRNELRSYARKGLPDDRTVAQDLQIAVEIAADREHLATERKILVDGAGGTWTGEDPDALVRDAERGWDLRELRHKAVAAGVPVPLSTLAFAHPSTPAERRRGLARRSSEAARTAERLRNAYWSLFDAVSALGEPKKTAPEPTFDEMAARIERWAAGKERYRAWARYGQQAADVEAIGLGAVVEAHREGRVGAVELPALIERSVLTRWVDAVRDAEPELRAFSGADRHRRIARFRRIDQQHLSLGARQVAVALDQRVPRVGGEVADTSEPGILLREAAKKTRQKSVRRVLQEIPNLVARLKPCVLMSPMSIAQYLPADGRRFDLVVFDEASQIGTHDAIGALARGNQVIVVGDSRQLPPTTFFSRAAAEEADENDFDELESILEEAVASGLPEQMLGWHYRSRHEDLIRFSNEHYYDGRLSVFPSARRGDEALGLRWHPVPDGVYDKARTRTNPIEARALVEHLVAALRETEPGLRTFGVVTFSQPQQALIDDLLDEARRLDPRIEPHFTLPDEPVFVKNLENVQGDERDEILFSIGYGPDGSGRLWMNFGPLNREGGERRLNVAVTRARRQLRVFSTLTWDRIDLARTRAKGVRHLREFLRYAAERGDPARAGTSNHDFSSSFEREVADVLIARGWEVETRVGCGSYRIDLAVVHPEGDGDFLLGVELDGPSYASAATARDRDRLRQDVLEGLGWRLHRIWSTDWWFDREREIRRLEQALDDALGGVSIPDDEPTDERISTRPAEEVPPIAVEPYVEAAPEPVTDQPALFHDAELAPELRRVLQQVLDVEAPIHVAELTRRVGGAFGVVKVTARAQKRVLSAAKKLERPPVVRGSFLWSAGLAPAQFDRVRGPSESGAVREVEHISPEEIASAARRVLAANLAMPHTDLVRETARLFGISRVGRKVADGVNQGIQLLVERGEAELQGERVVGRG